MNRSRIWKIVVGIVIILFVGWRVWQVGLHVYAIDEPLTARPSDCEGEARFAVIGDYGEAAPPEADVAALVDSWQVDFVVTVGDNNYPNGEASTIDENIGQFYSQYIYPYSGAYGPGVSENRFYPALGNHDWNTGSIQPYLNYFALPGNERYYDVASGPVHLFILDSDPHEPDGRTQDSSQAAWLEPRLKSSTAPWQLVFLHHPPYSSSLRRGGDIEMRWPFADWGADAVIAGHDHLYERLFADGIPYIVNGLGGKSSGLNPIYRFSSPDLASKVRYNRDYGAMLVTAGNNCINLSFYDRRHSLIDSLTLLPDDV